MVPSVTEAAMAMSVDVLRWEQSFEGRLNIAFAASSEFEDGHSRGGMRNKDVDEAIAAPATEVREIKCQVCRERTSGIEVEFVRIHTPSLGHAATGSWSPAAVSSTVESFGKANDASRPKKTKMAAM